MRGTSFAVALAKGAISSMPSWLAATPGAAFDWARMENCTRPAVESHVFGVWKRTFAVPSASGNSERVAGSTIAQPAGLPATLRLNWSTMLPRLRTRISQEACAPGSTASVLGEIDRATPPGSGSSFFPS